MDAWTPTGTGWGTNNSPVQVSKPSGDLGVQKPGKPVPDNPHTAATEKIVADLAYALGLPVPPVTLWDRGGGAGDPRFVAVSAWAFTAPLTWGQAQASLSQGQRNSMLRAASAMIPFEMWVDAQDRQNDGNVLVDGASPAGQVYAAWIDYAFALDHTWKGNLAAVTHVATMFPPVGVPDGPTMKASADEILGLNDGAIVAIVNRIAIDYLPRSVADNIIRNLLSRRAPVRALM
jgi:hypothetical protein